MLPPKQIPWRSIPIIGGGILTMVLTFFVWLATGSLAIERRDPVFGLTFADYARWLVIPLLLLLFGAWSLKRQKGHRDETEQFTHYFIMAGITLLCAGVIVFWMAPVADPTTETFWLPPMRMKIGYWLVIYGGFFLFVGMLDYGVAAVRTREPMHGTAVLVVLAFSALLLVFGMMFWTPWILGLGLVFLGLAWAVYGYRLFILNRVLVYGALSIISGLLYLVSVSLLQAFFRSLLNQPSDLAVIGSTLLVAAVLQPLRIRIQKVIDRRFYRRRYDAQTTLAAFSASLHKSDNADLNKLTAELLGVIQETMQPEHLSIWLREPAPKAEGTQP